MQDSSLKFHPLITLDPRIALSESDPGANETSQVQILECNSSLSIILLNLKVCELTKNIVYFPHTQHTMLGQASDKLQINTRLRGSSHWSIEILKSSWAHVASSLTRSSTAFLGWFSMCLGFVF